MLSVAGCCRDLTRCAVGLGYIVIRRQKMRIQKTQKRPIKRWVDEIECDVRQLDNKRAKEKPGILRPKISYQRKSSFKNGAIIRA